MTDFKCFTPQKAPKQAWQHQSQRGGGAAKSVILPVKKLQLLPILQDPFKSRVVKLYWSAMAQGSSVVAGFLEHSVFLITIFYV